jgi:hypothetical protein
LAAENQKLRASSFHALGVRQEGDALPNPQSASLPRLRRGPPLRADPRSDRASRGSQELQGLRSRTF